MKIARFEDSTLLLSLQISSDFKDDRGVFGEVLYDIFFIIKLIYIFSRSRIWASVLEVLFSLPDLQIERISSELISLDPRESLEARREVEWEAVRSAERPLQGGGWTAVSQVCSERSDSHGDSW